MTSKDVHSVESCVGETTTQVQLNEDGSLTLSGEFNIFRASDLYAALCPIVTDEPSELVIDLSGLTEIDAAGLQLLLALRAAVPQSQVHSCPPPVREFIERVGLTQVLT